MSTRHSPELGIVQSIFSLASRRYTPSGLVKGDRRDVELKMDWTKPWRFGRAIALWVLNGIDQFCFGSRSTERLRVGLPRQ